MSTDAALRATREQLLLRLLIRLTRLMTVETVTRMQKRGVKGMQAAYVRLLGNLDTEGTRVGALARKIGITRQAVAQLAKEIEAAGFVERIPDPDDGRGVIVRFTRKGRAALACAVEVMLEIEGEYAAVIGADGLARSKALASKVLEAFDKHGTFGLD
jgi:DNA-binding MarR family transcriptional regulator